MRQFFIASATEGPKAGTKSALTDIKNGQVAFALCDGGANFVKVVDENTVVGHKKLQLLFGNVDVTGQHRVESFPFFANDLSYSVMEYKAASTFTATVTVDAPSSLGPHTLIFAKKGVPFNERNKWSEDVYVKDSSMTADDLATALRKAINENSESIGLTATGTGADIVLTAKEPAVSYEVLAADELTGHITISAVTEGLPGEADQAMVIDLANKAIADRGVNDTYAEASEYMHPRYPVTRGSAALAEKYDIITIRFAEPRLMKTRDEVVHQIIQIALPYNNNQKNHQQFDYIVDILDALGALEMK